MTEYDNFNEYFKNYRDMIDYPEKYESKGLTKVEKVIEKQIDELNSYILYFEVEPGELNTFDFLASNKVILIKLDDSYVLIISLISEKTKYEEYNSEFDSYIDNIQVIEK